MEYYRLSQKLNWLLERVGRKWKIKKGALQVICHFLKMIGETEFLLGEMEKIVVRTFGNYNRKPDKKTNTGYRRNSALQFTPKGLLVFYTVN